MREVVVPTVVRLILNVFIRLVRVRLWTLCTSTKNVTALDQSIDRTGCYNSQGRLYRDSEGLLPPDMGPYEETSDKQVALLSQRDRAAGWVSYGQKWKTGTGVQYLGL